MSHDDYWFKSEKISTCLDSDNEDEETTTSSGDIIESFLSLKIDDPSVLSSETDLWSSKKVLPIEALISKTNLDYILADVQLPAHTNVPAVEETVLSIFLRRPYKLETYRSLKQKLELLDAAVKNGDGNVILTVLLYLKQTLQTQILVHHLIKRKTALQQYTHYLLTKSRFQEVADILMGMENTSQLLQLLYLENVGINYSHRHIKKLESAMIEHSGKLNKRSRMLLNDYVHFTQYQVSEGLQADSKIEQLAILCQNVWKSNKPDADSTMNDFKRIMKIHSFQFEWTQLNVLAALKMWSKLTSLFIKSNWLNKNLIKSIVPARLLVWMLFKHEAPEEVLITFLSCIADAQISATLAHKVQCYKFVIDLHLSQKDRASLAEYKQILPTNSQYRTYADQILNTPDVRWKN